MAACKLDDAVRFLPDDLHAKAQEVARSPQIAEVPTQALVPSGAVVGIVGALSSLAFAQLALSCARRSKNG